MHDSNLSDLRRLAFGYVRVSTEKQERDGNSLDNQTSRIREFAESHNFVLAGIYEDVGSARDHGRNDGLPELRQTFREAFANSAPVIVTSVDRISRDEAAALRLLETFPVSVISIDHGRILSAEEVINGVRRANLAGDRIAAKTSIQLQRRKSGGKHLGSPGDKKKAAKLVLPLFHRTLTRLRFELR